MHFLPLLSVQSVVCTCCGLQSGVTCMVKVTGCDRKVGEEEEDCNNMSATIQRCPENFCHRVFKGRLNPVWLLPEDMGTKSSLDPENQDSLFIDLKICVKL